MPSQDIPQDQVEAIVAAYAAGASVRKAGALYGYSETICRRVLKSCNILLRSHSEACRIPREHEESIIAAYLDGATMHDASALFGYSERTCINALKRRGLQSRSHAEACRIPPEHEEKIIEAYLEGASTIQAAHLYGYSQQTCTNILNRHGITPRTREEVCRRYSVDESFFDAIDTEEKAYWLGFLTADGGIVNGAIHLSLQERDVGHVQKFADALCSNHPIRIVPNGKYYRAARIVISSIRLVKSLNRLGLTPNKSFFVTACQQFPVYLLNAYWRGIFDGDGSISEYPYNQYKSYWQLSLVGNEFIVTSFQDFIKGFVVSSANVKPHKRIFQIKYNGSKLPALIGHILYADATVYLERKFARVQKMLSSIEV